MAVLNAQPVVLASTPATMPAGLPVAPFSAQPGIRNTDSVGVLIDKFVFTGSPAGGALAGLRVELKWQNEMLTGGPVVVSGITWPQNRGIEALDSFAVPLSKPLYLAPGDYISVSFLGDLVLISAIATTYQVAAIGRQCAAPPDELWLPYFADYLGPVYTINGGGAISDQSTPADLGNPFATDLLIERMIGRVLINGGGNSWREVGSPQANMLDFNLRLSDHRDNFWVANPTPLPLAFNEVDRSWILNHALEPKGFLRLEFEGTANHAITVAGTLERAVVGLIGYRRIAP